ncbi:MAG: endolytic transglycosylase MltG [Bacteroidetes bacterium]|jgi:UPF0755 protein|nr:endolytic transglycosylase MltG [Bacteroidota bacterium]
MSYYYTKNSRRGKQKKSKWRRLIFSVLLILILIGSGTGYLLYTIILKPNVWVQKEQTSIFIPSEASYQMVLDTLYSKGIIIHRKNFEWLAQHKSYPELVKPGHYIIRVGMNNNELINLLRAGLQSPVDVTFNNLRTVEQLAANIAKQIEADSLSIITLLYDTAYIGQLGFNPQTIPALFIPNTYEFYWTTDATTFISRMFQEYRSFWNPSRLEKAKAIGLEPYEVSTLASIIEKETNKQDEKATIAGVYLNRLKADWRLQADPTLVFASGDFGIQRVLDVHKLIDSPYNTYKNSGLPPGPISIPDPTSIDAVLNYETHRYYFFCAKDDLSGYHAFAETNREHERNARAYRNALNKLNIKK